MGNFNRGNRSGGGRSFGGGRDFNNRGEDRPMFKTVCSKCGKECEVPFKPTGSKPVFCRDCFREQGGNEARRPERGNFSKPNFDSRNENRERRPEAPQYGAQIEALNVKLDKILNMLSLTIPEKKTLVVKEEKAVVNKEEILPVVEQAPTPEKKKRAPKKTVAATEEQTQE